MYKSNDLNFCKLEKSDAECLLSLKRESWMSTHNVTIANHNDQMIWFDSLNQHVHSPQNLVLKVSFKDESGFIGIFKITNADYVNRSADVAWDVLESYRGKGYGKRLVAGGSNFCFDILNLRRLTAEILSTNLASQKCAQFAEFKLEGLKKEAVHKPEGYVDSQVWGLLKKSLIQG